MRVVIQQDADVDVCDPGTFGKILEDNPEVMVTVTQTGCPKCRTYTRAARELEGEIDAPRVEIELSRSAEDPCQKIADILKADDLPTVLYFRDGKETGRIVGAEDKAEMKKRIRSLLGR